MGCLAMYIWMSTACIHWTSLHQLQADLFVCRVAG